MVTTTFEVHPIRANVEAYHQAYARYKSLRMMLGTLNQE
jgi:hypothetical protein